MNNKKYITNNISVEVYSTEKDVDINQCLFLKFIDLHTIVC